MREEVFLNVSILINGGRGEIRTFGKLYAGAHQLNCKPRTMIAKSYFIRLSYLIYLSVY